MGHRRTRKIYKLTFEQPEHMVGLEVLCYGPTKGQLFRIARLGDVDLDNLESIPGDKIRELDELTTSMADRIIEWNHEDEDGSPLLPTRAVLDQEDYDFSLPLVRAWMMSCMGVTPDAKVVEQTEPVAQFAGQTTLEEQLAALPMQ